MLSAFTHSFNRKCILLAFILCQATYSFAQKKLLFYNIKTLQTIEMKEGHKASILYKGYMGQYEMMIHTVTLITDSTITLGANPAGTLFEQQPGKRRTIDCKVIRVEDIVGFRRMTLGRQIAQTTFSVGALVGTYVLLRNVYANNNIGTGGAFFISLGTGLGTLGITRLLFPENIKYYMDDGWKVQVMGY